MGREVEAVLLVSRWAQERFRLQPDLLSPDGTLKLEDVAAARRLAHHLNQSIPRRKDWFRAGELNATGLLLAHQRQILRCYLKEALAWLCARLGQDKVDTSLQRFLQLFPPISAHPETRSRDQSQGLEQILLLIQAQSNPALESMSSLFLEPLLERDQGFQDLEAGVGDFLCHQMDGVGGPLLQLATAKEVFPASLKAQLLWLLESSAAALPEEAEKRLLRAVDILEEEELPPFHELSFGPGAPQEAHQLELQDLAQEAPRHSSDSDWMTQLVLQAKHVPVWLYQLSNTYSRKITRLDEIPEEELANLAGHGFTGLWLLGIWKRSDASRQLKRLLGNPEAEASMYALDGYRIAPALGGPEALESLKARALEHGIRLACDMVPNHMGLDSEWVLRHPHRFISLPECPFPGYSFTGPNLSPDPQVGLWVEDGYLDRSDAAVVFKRQDLVQGDNRYIYHGNDGTGLPWNDTAQLDYLNEETRQAVTAAVLEVARLFPIIRMDAAMTLVSQHIQRLWYPKPGQGGAVPSRSEHGLSTEAFLQRLPSEFWIQVVDRVQEEVPDSLILAEAFWLLEGYFVRNLGVNRVYNSAFLNALRQQDMALFQTNLRNILAYDPRLLERFVNFLTTPDETPAATAFPDPEAYFAACTLLATLPGTPLFGHGQVEGLEEKYGMEYRRPYGEETPRPELLERHRREIAPLLRKRGLFARAEGFRLLDFQSEDGKNLDQVVAFSHHRENDRAVILVHFGEAAVTGHALRCAPFRDPEGMMVNEPLVQGLGLAKNSSSHCELQELITGQRQNQELSELVSRGLVATLGPWQRKVFLIHS